LDSYSVRETTALEIKFAQDADGQFFLIENAKYRKNQCFSKFTNLSNFQFSLHFLVPAQYDLWKVEKS